MDKIKLPFPVIVEGRYDKSKLSEFLDCQIITTNGFGIFNQKEKLALIKRLSQNGVVVLTDSDGAGSVIRGHIKSALPKDKVYNLYIPKIEGKEKTILFNLSGHGTIDLYAYEQYFANKLVDHEVSEAEIRRAVDALDKIIK